MDDGNRWDLAITQDRVFAAGEGIAGSHGTGRRPERADYHHLPGADVWTYEQEYTEIFLATRLYERGMLVTYEAGSWAWAIDVNPAHRCAVKFERRGPLLCRKSFR